MINLGEFYKLKVKRLSDLGYMLTVGYDEVLLHFGQSLSEHKVNDEVNVFLPVIVMLLSFNAELEAFIHLVCLTDNSLT